MGLFDDLPPPSQSAEKVPPRPRAVPDAERPLLPSAAKKVHPSPSRHASGVSLRAEESAPMRASKEDAGMSGQHECGGVVLAALQFVCCSGSATRRDVRNYEHCCAAVTVSRERGDARTWVGVALVQWHSSAGGSGRVIIVAVVAACVGRNMGGRAKQGGSGVCSLKVPAITCSALRYDQV